MVGRLERVSRKKLRGMEKREKRKRRRRMIERVIPSPKAAPQTISRVPHIFEGERVLGLLVLVSMEIYQRVSH